MPKAEQKIVYDKFHIVRHFTEAVDKVRRADNKRLRAIGERCLVGTKYGWLRNPSRETSKQKRAMATLRRSDLKTARAWAIGQSFARIWRLIYPRSAERFFERWYSWAIRSRLEPIKAVARMLKRRLPNVLTYCWHRITNAMAESLNAKIQWIKYAARGFKSREGFRTAIYFHCGGLDLYPHQRA